MLTAARLAANVSVTGASAARAELLGMGGAVEAAGAGLSGLGRISSGLGGALSHAKGAISGLLTGPLGMLALGGGALGLGSFFKSGIDDATALGEAVEKLQTITGETPEALSGLLAVFAKFNISSDSATTLIGRLVKNVGTLSASSKTAATFTREYGFSLNDANGKVLSANALILEAADYFNNKSIPATEKAAAMTKLFGKTWLDMVPMLSLGSKGITDAKAAAAALGQTLSTTNAGQLTDFQKNMRDLGSAVGGLQLQIGLGLVPIISGLALSLKGWLTNGGSAQLLTWFHDGLTTAQQLGHAIQTVVVPAIGGIAAAWNLIPGPVKTLILGAFIGNRAVKWLFGIDISSIAKAGVSLAASFLAKIVGANLGSAVASQAGGLLGTAESAAGVPVYVTNWAEMGGGGLAQDLAAPVEVVGGGGLFGGLITALTTGVVAPLAVVAAAAAALAGVAVVTSKYYTDRGIDVTNLGGTGVQLQNFTDRIQTRNPAWTKTQADNLTAAAQRQAQLLSGGASVNLIGEHSGLGDKLVAQRNADQVAAQKNQVALNAIRAAELATGTSLGGQLTNLKGAMDDVRTTDAHVGQTDAGYASAGLGVQRQILSKKPTLSVKITPSTANVVVDGKVLAHTMIAYFPHGMGGIGLE